MTQCRGEACLALGAVQGWGDEERCSICRGEACLALGAVQGWGDEERCSICRGEVSLARSTIEERTTAPSENPYVYAWKYPGKT